MEALKNDAELIKELGGPTKVARLLRYAKPVSPQRVQNWLTRGIPAQVKLDHPHLFLARGGEASQEVAHA